jgi:2-hydroxy-6-oxonona-2,4-dienedioate hydrolase
MDEVTNMFLWPELASGKVKLDYVQAGSIRTRYLEAGDTTAREAVVFIPGTGGHLEAFTRNILPHAEHYRTIALDMVGHGFTDKPDHDYEIKHYVTHLSDFCDALGLDRIHVHGESLGGWIAAQFAIDHPNRTASLTLNTAGGLNTDPKVMERVYNVTMKAVAEASPETVRARLEWLMNDPRRVTDDLVELRYAIYTQPGFVRAMEHILCLQNMDIRMRNVLTDESLTAIKARTLVIWTDHDPTAPIATGERFVTAIPHAEPLVIIDDCAHWPQWEKSEEFNRIHLAFLARCTASARADALA